MKEESIEKLKEMVISEIKVAELIVDILLTKAQSHKSEFALPSEKTAIQSQRQTVFDKPIPHGNSTQRKD
jgi:hypothetical protein